MRDDTPTLPIPMPTPMAPDGRSRRSRAGLAAGAIGALGVVLVGAGAPAMHAATTSHAADARSAGAARAGSLPPALPVRGAASTEAITDIWGRGSGAPPRSG